MADDGLNAGRDTLGFALMAGFAGFVERGGQRVAQSRWRIFFVWLRLGFQRQQPDLPRQASLPRLMCLEMGKYRLIREQLVDGVEYRLCIAI